MLGRAALRGRIALIRQGQRIRYRSTAPTTTTADVQKRVDDDMLETIDIEDLPRAQKRFAKQFEKVNEERIKELFAKNYKNHIAMAVLLCLVVGIYYYTIHAVKQETMNTEEVPKVPEKSYDDVKHTHNTDHAPSEVATNSVEESRNQLDNNNSTSEKVSSTPPSSSVVDNSSVPPPEETVDKSTTAPPPTIVCDESVTSSPPSTSRSSKSPAVKERSPAPSPAPVPPARTKKRKVTDFRCAEVRWFYRRNEADKWINFNGRDSLCLEAKYRSVFSIPLDDQMTVELLEHGFTFRQSVVVLEGLYKANDELNKVEAIYWKGDSCEIRRGTWFLQDWQPLEPPVAEAIEAHHLQYFRGQAIPEGLTVFSPKETSNKPRTVSFSPHSCFLYDIMQ
ncbi:hypothetical protein OSTOST_17938, partial [Ostertagia ostertagi]